MGGCRAPVAASAYRWRMLEDRYIGAEHLERIPDWHTEESPWKARNIDAFLRRNGLSPASVCEVGCGFGEVLAQLQLRFQQPCDFWGYDISPIAIAHALERSNEHLHFALADLTVKEPDRVFELMLVLDVVEHVEDYFGFLQKIRSH